MSEDDMSGPDTSLLAAPALSVVNRLLEHAHHPVRADDPAIGLVDGPTYTYREVAQRAAGWQRVLAGAGVGPGEIVAVWSENSELFYELLFACGLGGQVFMPLNIHYSENETRAVIEAYEPSFVIGRGPGFGQVADAMGAGRSRDLDVEPLAGNWAETEVPSAPVAVDRENEPLWMALTGGTTGLSKACIITHRRLALSVERGAHVFGYRPDGLNLVCGPLFHAQALLFGLLQLDVGGQIRILPKFRSAAVADAIPTFRVTHLCMVPTMWTDFATEAAKRPAGQLDSLRVCVSAGSPLRSAVKDAIAKSLPGAGLFEYYGSTEGGYFTVLRPEERSEHGDTVGTPFPGVRIEVRREDGSRCEPGELGIIHRLGEVLGGAYYRRPEQTADLYADGWLSNGDVGFLDEAGYLHLGDRLDDMIITGGVNVYPADIEQVISAMSSVAEVAVIGLEDHRWGQVVTAFVALNEGASDRAGIEEEILSVCRSELSSFKVPKVVHVVDELPRTPVGKVKRADLPQLVSSLRGTSVDEIAGQALRAGW